MANFVIMRCEKLKGAGKIATAAAHINRERPCEHADPALKDQNFIFGNLTTAAVMADWREQISHCDRAVRKDAVGGIEYLFAYTPTAENMHRGNQDEFFEQCNQWLEKRHGKHRILIGGIHRDEVGGPHMHVIVVPLVEYECKRGENKGKTVLGLSAKTFMDGGKKLAQAQTEIGMIGKPFGLERGIEHSTATHQKVRRMYGMLDRPEIDQVKIPEKKLMESMADYALRIQKVVQKQLERAFDLIKKIAKAEKERADKLAQELAMRPTAKDVEFLKGERDRWKERAEKAEKTVASFLDKLATDPVEKVNAWLKNHREQTALEKARKQAELEEAKKQKNLGIGG